MLEDWEDAKDGEDGEDGEESDVDDWGMSALTCASDSGSESSELGRSSRRSDTIRSVRARFRWMWWIATSSSRSARFEVAGMANFKKGLCRFTYVQFKLSLSCRDPLPNLTNTQNNSLSLLIANFPKQGVQS